MAGLHVKPLKLGVGLLLCRGILETCLSARSILQGTGVSQETLVYMVCALSTAASTVASIASLSCIWPMCLPGSLFSLDYSIASTLMALAFSDEQLCTFSVNGNQ
jgi:hypothetical protein